MLILFYVCIFLLVFFISVCAGPEEEEEDELIFTAFLSALWPVSLPLLVLFFFFSWWYKLAVFTRKKIKAFYSKGKM